MFKAMLTDRQREKAKNAILHIAKKMEACSGYGSVVLNKVLFYADHIHYRDTGHKITGFCYVRQLRGPTPAPNEYMPIKDRLLRDGDAREEVRDYFGREQKRLIAVAPVDYDVFSKSELRTLDSTILMFNQVDGTTASNLSHEEEIGWQLAQQMEEIPASTFLLIEDDATEEDIAWGKKALEAFAR